MARRRPRRMGPPFLLDQARHDKLVEAVRGSAPVEMAAEYAGISKGCFMRWMAEGRDEQWSRDEDPDYIPDESKQRYVDLLAAITKARADAGVRNSLLVQRVAQGGAIVEESTRRYRGDDGQPVEETTVKRQAPDWRAAAWYLERQHPKHFGKQEGPTQVELTGAGGGPVQVASIDVTALAAKIAANRLAIEPDGPDRRALVEGTRILDAGPAVDPGGTS